MKIAGLIQSVEHHERMEWKTFDSHIVKGDGCWLWTGCTNSVSDFPVSSAGHHSVSKTPRNCYPHQVQWVRYNGIDKLREMARTRRWFIHTCRNRLCMNPEHIQFVTRREFCRQRSSIPTAEHFSAVLTQEQADEIRYKYENTPKRKAELSEEYGVSPIVVMQIVNGHSYGNRKVKPYRLKTPISRKLSCDDICEIFRLKTDEGLKHQEIAGRFAISISMVSRILSGERGQIALQVSEWKKKESLCATEKQTEKNDPSENLSTRT